MKVPGFPDRFNRRLGMALLGFVLQGDHLWLEDCRLFLDQIRDREDWEGPAELDYKAMEISVLAQKSADTGQVIRS